SETLIMLDSFYPRYAEVQERVPVRRVIVTGIQELEHQLNDSGSETLIMLDSFYPRYAEVQERVPVRRVIVTGIQ
ncbi:hypothetical protein CTI14_70135, partial [Methylobacterium radiotolerans]